MSPGPIGRLLPVGTAGFALGGCLLHVLYRVSQRPEKRAAAGEIGLIPFFRSFPTSIPEIELKGEAVVLGIGPCPPIADGEGSVVIGRFTTQRASRLACVTFSDGTQLVGTPSHPIWSADQNDWVRLADLAPGETVGAANGKAVVTCVDLVDADEPVYNVETYGEHVYQVADLGILVHNAGTVGIDCAEWFRVRNLELRGQLTDPKDIAIHKKLKNQIDNFRDYMDPKDLEFLDDLRPSDLDMPNSHLHHILQKLGNSRESAKEILEAQKILWEKYGINPFTDVEIFVWARNGVPGVHGATPAQHVVDAIKDAARQGYSKRKMRTLLTNLGVEVREIGAK